jgi:biopolymer transport protein ExbB
VGGLNPAIVLPILYLIALGIYIFVLGNPGNFQAKADDLLRAICSF